MSDITKELFNANKSQREDTQIIKVLVSLKSSPSDEILLELQELGLNQVSVINNKLVGRVAYENIQALEEHAEVIEVERSVTLYPTQDSDCQDK
jgi:hypothetical protein